MDAWQLRTWDDYRDVRRFGRKTGLPEEQRAILWSIFGPVIERLTQEELVTDYGMFTRLSELLVQGVGRPYDFVVVDEAQDMGVAHLRFFAALADDRPDALFFAGDLGQRIFQQPFSWRALGVDIRGRSRTLRVNYRTSHQIRQAADRLLDPEQTDADGVVENRSGTISVFNGTPPTIRVLADDDAEIERSQRGSVIWSPMALRQGSLVCSCDRSLRSDARPDVLTPPASRLPSSTRRFVQLGERSPSAQCTSRRA